jgi:hypothetical protein
VSRGLLRLDPKLLGALLGLSVERADVRELGGGEQELWLVVEDARIPFDEPPRELVLTIDRDQPEVRLGWELLGRPQNHRGCGRP